MDAQVGAKACRVALGAIAVRRDIAREQMETESARIISRAFGYLGYGMALQLLCRARCARALIVGASCSKYYIFYSSIPYKNTTTYSNLV